MEQNNICQFYIIVGDKDFKPLNNRDVYINATGVMDNNLIKAAIFRAFNKKNNENIKVGNEIIFLIPDNSFQNRCQEIISDLNIRGRIIKKQELINVNNDEEKLIDKQNITASGSKVIEFPVYNNGSNEDDLINNQSTTSKNNIYNFNQYSEAKQSEEKNKDVNASGISLNINSNTISSNQYGSRMDRENTQLVAEKQEFYLDDSNCIWDIKGNFIGEVGKNGVWVDYKTNSLIMNGRLMGYIDSYKNMGGHGPMSASGGKESSVHENPKKLILHKSSGRASAAFVSLPVIMFILSAMLLIGSLILLFVLE